MTPQAFPQVSQHFPRLTTLVGRFFPKDDATRLLDVFAYRHHNRRFEVLHVVEKQLAQLSTIEYHAFTEQVRNWMHNIIEEPEYNGSFSGPLYQEIIYHFIFSTICQDM